MKYKVALVTGASSGIGKAIVRSLCRYGINVILVARRQDRLEALQVELGDKCHVMACDISNTNDTNQCIEALPEAYSQIDVLVNCAGIALGLKPSQEADWEDWETMLSVNCLGLSYLTHLLLPNMVERNLGHIVNIGSIAGSYPYKGGNIYGATKAFVKQFTMNLKADLLGTAVRVSNIEPGMVQNSEFSVVRFKGDQEKASEVYEGITALEPNDIAESVAWVINQPAHVNVNRIEIMPVAQAPARTAYSKHSEI